VTIYDSSPDAFPPDYLARLAVQIRQSRCFTPDNLNRDFVGTRGFSVVFQRPGLAQLAGDFPFFTAFIERVLRPDCTGFYLNPLQLEHGSRVDPHIDRSLRAYCPEVVPPLHVSVLYVEVPDAMQGGELVLSRGKQHLARIRPHTNLLIGFAGDLTHAVGKVTSPGRRLSLVCEQYALTPEEAADVPVYRVETRAQRY
jgi:hypothetical protein